MVGWHVQNIKPLVLSHSYFSVPDMAHGPHSEIISSYFMHMKSLLLEGLVIGDILATYLKESENMNMRNIMKHVTFVIFLTELEMSWNLVKYISKK